LRFPSVLPSLSIGFFDIDPLQKITFARSSSDTDKTLMVTMGVIAGIQAQDLSGADAWLKRNTRFERQRCFDRPEMFVA
jgi:hypothetical protein